MRKFLMHKNTKVAEFTINNDHINTVTVLDEKLFPYTNKDEPVYSLRRWYIQRKTMLDRIDISPVTRFYGSDYFTSSCLRSMNDCYWLKDVKNELDWEDISPYQLDDLESDGIFLSIVKPKDFEGFTDDSPNLTLPGVEPLFWYINSNKLGQINANAQEDMNAYKVAKDNNIHIFKERQYVIIAGNIYTFKEVETCENIERIPFDQIYLFSEDKSLSKNENLRNCCEKNKIPNWDKFIKELIMFNKIYPSKKIELFDVGVLRNANTLEYIGFDKI